MIVHETFPPRYERRFDLSTPFGGESQQLELAEVLL